MEVKEESFHLGVKALIMNAEGDILLLQRRSDQKDKQTWDLPGGRVQKGEAPENTLRREVYEETGLQHLQSIDFVIMELTKFRISLPLHEVGLIFSIYRCSLIKDEPVVLSNEHSDHQWISPSIAANLLKLHYPEKVLEVLSSEKFKLHGLKDPSFEEPCAHKSIPAMQ